MIWAGVWRRLGYVALTGGLAAAGALLADLPWPLLATGGAALAGGVAGLLEVSRTERWIRSAVYFPQRRALAGEL